MQHGYRAHLSAPRDRPRTSCFCAIHPAAMTGRQQSVAAADSSAQYCPSFNWKPLRNTGAVPLVLVRNSAKKN